MIAFACPKCKTPVAVCHIAARPTVSIFTCIKKECNYTCQVTDFKITIVAPVLAPKKELKIAKEPNHDIGTVPKDNGKHNDTV